MMFYNLDFLLLSIYTILLFFQSYFYLYFSRSLPTFIFSLDPFPHLIPLPLEVLPFAAQMLTGALIM